MTLVCPSLVLLLPCQELLRGVEKLLEDKDHTLQLRQVEIEHLRHQHQEQVEVRGEGGGGAGGAVSKQWCKRHSETTHAESKSR